MRPLLRGLVAGACVGLAVFAADLLTAGIAHASRFAPTPETFSLLGLLALACVVPAAVVGLLAALLLRGKGPKPWLWPPVVLVLATGVLELVRPREHLPDGRDRVSCPVTAAEPRDVLWITIDTLRADALYGAPDGSSGDAPHAPTFADTPEIGAFARTSTVFTQAEAPAGWTIPSTAAMLTGRTPSALGARAGFLPEGADTAAELLRAAGWRTIAHVDNALLDEVNGFAAGFQRFEKRIPMEFAWSLTTSRLFPARVKEDLRYRMRISYAGAEDLVDRTITDLEAAPAAPLFLYVHAMDPHTPYWSTPEDPAQRKAARAVQDMERASRRAARRNPDFLDAEGKDAIRALYRAEVETTDRAIGRLLRRFDELRGLENAVVVLTADHGEEFWEHGKLGHGQALYGEVVHVPLIVHAPRDLVADAPALVDAPVSLVDVLPTVADLVGLAGEGDAPAFDGRSLAPALHGEPLPARPLHAELFRYHRELQRWREGDLVLIRGELPEERSLLRFYDLASDPTEMHDLAAERPEDAARLGRDLDACLDALRRGSVDAGEAHTYFEGLNRLGY